MKIMNIINKIFNRSNNCKCHKKHLKKDSEVEINYLRWDNGKIKTHKIDFDFSETVPITEHQEVKEVKRMSRWKDIGNKDRKIYIYYVTINCKECGKNRKEKLKTIKTDIYI